MEAHLEEACLLTIAIKFKPTIFPQGVKHTPKLTLRLFCIPRKSPRTDGVRYGAP